MTGTVRPVRTTTNAPAQRSVATSSSRGGSTPCGADIHGSTTTDTRRNEIIVYQIFREFIDINPNSVRVIKCDAPLIFKGN